jgi:ABC-type glutathione transport system ATPase component
LTVSFPAYGRVAHRALNNLSLSIQRGEIVGLVGESGSGKTTLARAIMGMVPPPGVVEQGQIEFDGTELTTLDPRALRQLRGRNISMMVPNPRSELNPLMPHRSISGSRRVRRGAWRSTCCARCGFPIPSAASRPIRMK